MTDIVVRFHDMLARALELRMTAEQEADAAARENWLRAAAHYESVAETLRSEIARVSDNNKPVDGDL